jgi:hypothetical protein
MMSSVASKYINAAVFSFSRPSPPIQNMTVTKNNTGGTQSPAIPASEADPLGHSGVNQPPPSGVPDCIQRAGNGSHDSSSLLSLLIYSADYLPQEKPAQTTNAKTEGPPGALPAESKD